MVRCTHSRQGDAAYETIAAGTPLHAGQGYWAYFPASTTLQLPADSTTGITLALPAGQYVMVGNPSSVTVTVTGADLVSIYDPASGYQQRTTLSPGQGAWALSSGGAVLTLAPSTLTVTIPPLSAPGVAVGLPLTLTSPSSTTAPPAASGPPAGCTSYTGGPCVTLCADGQWSSSTGSGTCSSHGGEAVNAGSRGPTVTAPATTSSASSGSACVSYTGGPCVTLCKDGQWSSSTGRGTCSGHGGEQR